MRNLALAILLCTFGSPAWATTYYLAPAASGGSDSNNGTTASTPWLTPNHAVNCGDVIIAAASTAYLGVNFQFGNWGTVTCASGNNVAWLKCVTFDACKMTASNANEGMAVTQSYWGVQGWEVTSTVDGAFCFIAYPSTMTSSTHHVIFANDIANGCYGGGFGSGQAGTAGTDYIVVIGNIVYNAAKDIGGCFSGIDIYEPVNTDTLPGTHFYIAGNLSYSNLNPPTCGSGTPSDGEGVILDTLDGSTDSLVYTGQIVVDNNLLLSNGGRGLQVLKNAGATYAHIYLRNNTLWGNNTDTNQTNTLCGELLINAAFGVEAFRNLAATSAAKGCYASSTLYDFSVKSGNGSDQVYNNTGWAASGTYSAVVNSAGFSYGPNSLFGTNPSFVNATAPGAPSCGSASSVLNCMAKVIANFTPTTATAKAYGYQIPVPGHVYDPLFPQWLCNVNLPAGLVTMGCLAQSSFPAVPTITSVSVQ